MKASEILLELDLEIGTAARADVQRAWHLMDDCRVIQKQQMWEIFDAPLSDCADIRQALLWLGCTNRR